MEPHSDGLPPSWDTGYLQQDIPATLVTVGGDHSPRTQGISTGGVSKSIADETVGRSLTLCPMKVRMPLGINRFALFFLYCLVALMTGCVYWGWNGIQDMLYKSGAFEDACNDPAAITQSVPIGGITYPDCPDRQKLINNFYTVAFSCHFVFSAFAGFILDIAGPKICILMGFGASSIGWLLLAFSSRTFNAYYAAAAFIGLSAEPGYLPLLGITYFFPGNESLVMSVLGSVRSLSFAMPVIKSALYTGSDQFVGSDFWKFCVGYVGVSIGVSIVISILLVPWKSFQAQSALQFKKAQQDDAVGTQPDGMLKAAIGKDTVEEITDQSSRRPTGVPGSSSSVEVPIGEDGDTEKPMTFWQALVSPEFLMIVPFFCLSLVRSEFYTKSNKNQLTTTSGSDLLQMYSILNILSFIPGPIMGKLADKYGILSVIFGLNFFGILMYVFIMPDILACKGISIVFYFIYTSFVLSNLYCYVGVNFPHEQFGKLTGLACLIAGLWTLTSLGWYSLSAGTFASFAPYNYLPVDAIMVAYGLINVALWIGLYRRKKSKDKRKKRVGIASFDTADNSPVGFSF